MKVIHYLLICCLLGLVSCGGSDNLTSFSKRKYLKNPPKQKTVEQVIQAKEEVYASNELTPETFVLKEMPEVDYKQESAITTELASVKTYPFAESPVEDELTYEKEQMERIQKNFENGPIFQEHQKSKGDPYWDAVFSSGPWWLVIIIVIISIFAYVLAGKD